ncbi:hypothetical protein GUITHDRAFT_112815 [Guillardia theta CCMP2712]|uniref:Rab-GAP TBC domain-containing protein n=1 Tax=Guillardia theta (strain CCMP2712) TaxID=905079 RepID=L1IY93_GUITC|nr:hypothetical protein GUITHDRAFT_112815 [Guillardia theta CCMP2712]EKX41082.1 hypothetical protein GUITHDRAFT_112815 [Guillardia theta CCMP2712]|eukprot:XP_005828062.1 hypothetical protein GUITHDRAFT_112815 [Guillardia theta CCMP2712]
MVPTSRSRYWKITLGYLPPDKGKWMEVDLFNFASPLEKVYLTMFSQDLVAVGKDSSEWQDCESPTATGRQDDAVKKSQLASKNLMDEINKDTKRTWPDLHFFRENFGTLSETELKAQKEGDMVQVLRLWDSILAQEDELRMPFVLHLCCAMVIRIRADLLQEEDFAENLQRLQQYPRDFDIEDLIYEAKRLEGLSGAMQIEV